VVVKKCVYKLRRIAIWLFVGCVLFFIQVQFKILLLFNELLIYILCNAKNVCSNLLLLKDEFLSVHCY